MAEDRQRYDALFGTVETTHSLLAEAMIDAATTVSGSGPVYVFAVVEAMARAGATLRLPQPLTDALARITLAGVSAMLAVQSADPARPKAAVRSLAGTADAAMRVFGAESSMAVAVMSATLPPVSRIACARSIAWWQTSPSPSFSRRRSSDAPSQRNCRSS